MYAARGLYVSLDVSLECVSAYVSLYVSLDVRPWMCLCICVPGMCPWNVSLRMCLFMCLCICVPGMCPWNVCLVCVSLDVFLWFARAVFSSLCLVSTLKNDQSKCNEAYQTPVTSNVRLISSRVTRKVSSVLLDYVLKVEQGLGLPGGDSRMCRSRYVSKGKVR